MQQDYRQYDWIDVTFEAYWDVGQCGELINSPFEFYNFTISTLNGDIQVPDWYVIESDEIKPWNSMRMHQKPIYHKKVLNHSGIFSISHRTSNEHMSIKRGSIKKS